MYNALRTPAAVAAALTASIALADQPAQPAANFMLDSVMVRVRAGTTADQIAALDAKINAAKVLYASKLVPGLRCIQIPVGTVHAAVAALAADGSVLYASPNYIRTTTAQDLPYGVNRVNAPLLWPTTRAQGTLVADLDTGMDLLHPDLPTPFATSFTGEDVQDGHGHGTHTAGTIAALDNDFGVVGVAPACSLLVGKVLSNGGSGADSWVAAGIDWAVENHARVINMSLGSPDNDPALGDSCDAALAAGTLVVAAAGNSNSSAPFYPASYPSVLAVAAVDSANNRAGFSNFGAQVSLAAPGVNVESTFIGGGTVTWQGAAHDAGILDGSGPGPVSAPVVFCGIGNPEDFPPEGIAGKIAHIRRGTLLFIDKANNAIAAGAIGVIISNNVAGSYSGTLNTDVSIPVVGITMSDGDALQAASPAGQLSAEIDTIGGHTYANLNGTSMAAPHVTGVATLLFSLHDGAFTPAQVREAMEQTATDLGDPGRDDLYGHGLVNAQAAAAYLESHFAATCTADLGTQGGLAGHDGQLDNNDFIAFISAFFAADPSADLGAQGGIVGNDNLFDNNDFIAFIDAFFSRTGC